MFVYLTARNVFFVGRKFVECRLWNGKFAAEKSYVRKIEWNTFSERIIRRKTQDDISYCVERDNFRYQTNKRDFSRVSDRLLMTMIVAFLHTFTF